MTKTNRPKIKARRWAWKDGSTETPGIGLFRDGFIQGHLPVEEARAMADRIHDLCDLIEEEAPVTEPALLQRPAGVRSLRPGPSKRAMPQPHKQPAPGWAPLTTETTKEQK